MSSEVNLLEYVYLLSYLFLLAPSCFVDKPEEAIKAVRKALELHPWAAHLPTMLISMETEYKKPKSKSSSPKSAGSNSTATASSSSSVVRDI